MLAIRKSIQFVKDNKARMFWLWMAYQAIKGSLTLTLIWIPLFLLWKRNGGLETFWPDWGSFILANLAFVGSHIALLLPAVKASLINRVGRTAFWTLFTLVSISSFAFALYTALLAPRDVVWAISLWHVAVTIALTVLSVFFLVFGILSPNALSISIRPAAFEPNAPGFLRITRHPILWAIVFWAIGHIISNGEASLIVFFGLQAVFSLVGMTMLDKRQKRLRGEECWKEVSQSTGFFPNPLRLRLSFKDGAIKRPWRAALIAGLLFVALIVIHPFLFGVSPLSWLMS